jgi:hypothetical protein
MSNKILLKRYKDIQRLPYTLGVPISPRTLYVTMAVIVNNTETLVDFTEENGGIEITNDVSGAFNVVVQGAQRDKLFSAQSTLKPTVKVFIWLFNPDETAYARGEHSIGIDL